MSHEYRTSLDMIDNTEMFADLEKQFQRIMYNKAEQDLLTYNPDDDEQLRNKVTPKWKS